MNRKVIQIAQATSGESSDMVSVVVALCDDGTMWEGYNRYQGKGATPLYTFTWEQLPAIPHDLSNLQKVRNV